MKAEQDPANLLIVIGYTIVALSITFNSISKQMGTCFQRLIRSVAEKAPVRPAADTDVDVRNVQQDWDTSEAAKLPAGQYAFLSFYASEPQSELPPGSRRRKRFTLRLDPFVPVEFFSGDYAVQVRRWS